MSLTPQRIAIAACCGLIATGALYATQQRPGSPPPVDSATLTLPAMAAPAAPEETKPDEPDAAAKESQAAGVPRVVRRVVVTHDRPGQIVFSWDGPDLKVEIIDAAPSKVTKGASAQ